MRLKDIFIALLLIVYFPSCKCLAECFPEYTGKVVSNSSGAPIEGATVELMNQNISVKTDKNGVFKLATSGCFDPHFVISKQHYKPFEITFTNSSNSNSYKVKSQSKSVDYDKPFYPDSTNNNSFITGTWIKHNSESFSVSSDQFTYYLDTLKNISDELMDIQNEIKARIKLQQ